MDNAIFSHNQFPTLVTPITGNSCDGAYPFILSSLSIQTTYVAYCAILENQQRVIIHTG